MLNILCTNFGRACSVNVYLSQYNKCCCFVASIAVHTMYCKCCIVRIQQLLQTINQINHQKRGQIRAAEQLNPLSKSILRCL